MRRAALAAMLAALPVLTTLPGTAPRAQGTAVVYPGPGTLLRLSESAEVTRAPDEIRAALRFEARDATAAGAQAALNRVMAAALDTARKVEGVTPSTGPYRTWRQEDPVRWVAGQALNLRAADQARLLELIGTLQGRGLTVGGMGYNLTRDTARTAQQEAASIALDAIRRRADAVASGMGMRVERIAEVTLDGSNAASARMMAPAPAPSPMGARAAPPPVAQADDVVVSALVSAVVVLAPR